MSARFACALLALALLAACERATQDMYQQPKYKALAPSDLFDDGSASRTPPEGIIARSQGPFAGPSSGRAGEDAVAQRSLALNAARMPYPITAQLLRRGQERFNIYCAPCHSPAGDGDGPIVRRGFPAPPTYHSERLRQAPDRDLFDVITNGYGIMYPYADRVEPQDRWAIVAFIRALQLSQHAEAGALPPELRERLPGADK